MNRRRLIRFLGLALLAGCFAVAGWRAIRTETGAGTRGRVHLRLTHDMLHASVREAFAEAIAEYRALHPQVDIEIIEVPSRMFRTWRKTRLVGDTPPDLMRLGDGLTDEELARYFVPLTDQVQAPNPYNRGTPLEAMPWKDTFIDGLTSEESFSKALLEQYGITLHGRTYRFYCNRDLLERITGSRRMPATFREFFELCDTIREWARNQGEPIIPIAAYNESNFALLAPLMRQQTQRLSLAVNRSRTLTVSKNQAALAWLQGRWSVDAPPVTDGWALLRRLSLSLHPSFTQAQRNDAALGFLQQRAVMIASGTWDADTFMNRSGFDCGVFRLAAPTPEDEPFGRNVIDAIQETGVGGAAGTFGILRGSPHFEQALDFLHFLTSARVNKRLTDTMQLLPSVVGVPPHPRLEAFAPVSDGWPEGIDPDFTHWGSREVFRTVWVNMHRLVSPNGGVEPFVTAVAAAYPAALRRDLEQVMAEARRRAQRSDSAIIANQRLAEAGESQAVEKRSRLFENQAIAEGEQAQLRHALAERELRSAAGTP